MHRSTVYLDLETIHTIDSGSGVGFKVASALFSRETGETSLGDTTFIKDLLTNYDADFSPSSQQLVDLSAGISAYMQKLSADSSKSLSHFGEAGVNELASLMKSVMDGTSSNTEIDKLVFNTINWINENTAWSGGSITDNEEDMNTTTYSLSNIQFVMYTGDLIPLTFVGTRPGS